MLTDAGVAFRAVAPLVDEAPIKDALLAEGAAPRAIADALAEAKALKVSQRFPGAIVLGGDSTVAVAGRLYDKPAERGEAAAHLVAFSGQDMDLYSAAVIAEAGIVTWRHVDHATLSVRQLSTAFMTAYLDAEWPMIAGAVGCFRIEAMGVQLFDRIAGDAFTIRGMPLIAVLGHLRRRGVVIA